ncbi:MAG: kinase/pyrophosphorylase [Gammaproteobacteria bacterium]|nr:kinase/pyrophosphorylase [Gammaproteobacteria bacterium]
MKQPVFMLSDGTGITAEHLGNSLMSQFGHIEFDKQTIPYIDTLEKATAAIHKINEAHTSSQHAPLIFMTIVHLDIVNLIKSSGAIVFDLFNTFIEPLEQALETKSSYTVGQTHSATDTQTYYHRIEAVEFSLSHDDGLHTNQYDQADIVLIGVSRCGKTPSCLYMALHFGIKAANYPFTEDELNWHALPPSLKPHQSKLFGLFIHPERLHHIRSERSPGSHYASMEQCRREINEIVTLYKKEKIPYLDSTKFSIEEISTKILALMGLKRSGV